MANAVTTAVVTDNWYDGKRQHAIGTITITNFNYVTNGLPITWIGQEFIKSSIVPISMWIYGIAGFIYSYDPVNATIRIYQTGAALSGALAEMVNGAPLTAGVSTDTIRFHGMFKLI